MAVMASVLSPMETAYTETMDTVRIPSGTAHMVMTGTVHFLLGTVPTEMMDTVPSVSAIPRMVDTVGTTQFAHGMVTD